MRADLAFFHAHPSGILISRFTNDAMLLRNAAANVLAAIGRDAVTVVFLVGLMFYQDWVLALVSFFVFPLAIRPLSRHRPPHAAGFGQHPGRARPDDDVADQTFQGARHVKAYGMEDYEERRAAALFERLFVLIDRANARPLASLADDGGARRRGDRDRHPLWRPPGHQPARAPRARSSRSSPPCCSPISR